MTNVVYLNREVCGIPISWRLMSNDLKALPRDMTESILGNDSLRAITIKAFEDAQSALFVKLRKEDGVYDSHFEMWFRGTVSSIVDDLAVDGKSEGLGFNITIHPIFAREEMSVRGMRKLCRDVMESFDFPTMKALILFAEERIKNERLYVDEGISQPLLYTYEDLKKDLMNFALKDEIISNNYSIKEIECKVRKAIACVVVYEGEPYLFERQEIFGVVQ